MSSQYPRSWDGERPGDTQGRIRRLLQLRLTKYEVGFLRGLQTHTPTPRQSITLAEIENRYATQSYSGQLEGNRNDPQRTNSVSRTDQN
jgi:hypothetical protein